MERIIQEKTSADHLLYVSLKYTKTTDVILNLINRWKSLIDISIDRLLENAKKKRVINKIPEAPKIKIDKIRDIYQKNLLIMETMDLYEFFKKVENAEKVRENEFRKNVTLKVFNRGNWINIDIDKLKEYSGVIEKFVNQLRQIL